MAAENTSGGAEMSAPHPTFATKVQPLRVLAHFRLSRRLILTSFISFDVTQLSKSAPHLIYSQIRFPTTCSSSRISLLMWSNSSLLRYTKVSSRRFIFPWLPYEPVSLLSPTRQLVGWRRWLWSIPSLLFQPDNRIKPFVRIPNCFSSFHLLLCSLLVRNDL